MTKKLTSYFKGIYRPGAKYGRYLTVLLLTGIAYGLYRGVQDNYLAQIIRISEFERGIVEFLRELPGLLIILILAALNRMTDSRIFKIGTAVMFAGVAGLAAFGSAKFTVVLFIVIFSIGEHINMPVKSTISMDLAQKDKGGASLGLTGALNQFGSIAGLVIVTGLFALFSKYGGSYNAATPFKIVFGISTALMVAAVLISLAMQESELKPVRKRFYFAKKFTKYYILEVFYGARKQVFLTFAPYLMILQYGADTAVIAMLLAVSAVCGTVFSPLIGRLIDRLGYKKVMVADTLLLVLVCVIFGYSHRIFPPHTAFIVVCVNFVLDAVISLASMANNVYVQDIAENTDEMVATLSTGVSVNHLFSITIALFGGWIWAYAGVEYLFTISAALGVINSIYAATIKPPQKTV